MPTNASRRRWLRFCARTATMFLYVGEAVSGLSDEDVVALAIRERRLLLTEDKDFGDLVFRRKRTIPGVVLVRISSETPNLKSTCLAAAIERYGEGLLGRYTVIEEGRFRSRRLENES